MKLILKVGAVGVDGSRFGLERHVLAVDRYPVAQQLGKDALYRGHRMTLEVELVADEVTDCGATITPVIANHVLWEFSSGGYEPGGFVRHLLALLGCADLANIAQIANAYPGYARAVLMAQTGEIDTLQAIVDGESS